MRTLSVALALLVLNLPAIAAEPATPSAPGGPGGKPPGPPREAMEACAGKKVGEAVQFKGREGRDIKAVCQLIAVPERPAGPPPARPAEK